MNQACDLFDDDPVPACVKPVDGRVQRRLLRLDGPLRDRSGEHGLWGGRRMRRLHHGDVGYCVHVRRFVRLQYVRRLPVRNRMQRHDAPVCHWLLRWPRLLGDVLRRNQLPARNDQPRVRRRHELVCRLHRVRHVPEPRVCSRLHWVWSVRSRGLLSDGQLRGGNDSDRVWFELHELRHDVLPDRRYAGTYARRAGAAARSPSAIPVVPKPSLCLPESRR